MSTVKSKYQTPNETTGGYDDQHFETEISQLVDATGAAAHNVFYRGKDLTSYWESGEMSKAIQAGTFTDIYPGDYITKAVTVNGTTYTVKWEVADLDYFLHTGEAETTAHHVVMLASKAYHVNVSMNSTNTTEGGYVGSNMWKTIIPYHSTGIQNAFGSAHVLSHQELLTTAVSTTATSAAGAGFVGSSTNWAWTSVLANIMYNGPLV